MEYWEACDATIPARYARHEIEKHGADWEEFISDCGDRPEYVGKVILDWLGY